jgi:lipopolysaccharide transport system ATP-binding protein
MPDTVIRVDNLSKRYLLGVKQNSDGLRHVIQDAVTAPLRWLKKRPTAPQSAAIIGAQKNPESAPAKDFWALKGVSFEIKQGEVVAIIGRNGAGKSTLLKVLSRITEPTEGRVEINGRVASLLEVGTGFHPELTGRENIFLNGAILGMMQSEIKKKFDEIVAFAEVEKFLDTPVKRYSSGMYVRLAFAVAAHLEPEILVVDEVLAVGDAQFQKKCIGKMQEVSYQQGRTVIFVSHNLAAVLQLTSSAIVLEKGRVRYIGPTEKAVELYSGGVESESNVFFDVENTPRKYPGTQAARFVSFRFDSAAPIFSTGADFSYYAKIRAHEDIPRMRFSITIFTVEGIPVGSCFSVEGPGLKKGEEAEVKITLPGPRLAPGHYYCGTAVGKGDHRSGHVDFDVVLETLAFEIRPEEGEGGTVASWVHGWGAIVFPELACDRVK